MSGDKEVNILIVDDEPVIQRNIEKMLNRAGYTVTTASDTAEAMARLETSHFELVLLDVMMPDWTGKFSKQAGLDLLIEMRDRDWQIPVVMLTASKDVGTAVTSMKYGAYDYFEKGATSGKEFISKIEDALQSSPTDKIDVYKNSQAKKTNHPNSKWKRWFIARSVGLIDEVIGATVVGLLLYLFGDLTGAIKGNNILTIIYILVSVAIVATLLALYIKWQRKNRKQEK